MLNRDGRLNRMLDGSIWFGLNQSRHDGTRFDSIYLACIVALLGLGVVMVGSASMDVSRSMYGNPFEIVAKQFFYVLIGLGAMVVGSLVPAKWLQRHSFLMLGVAVALLVLVLIVGREVNGSTRWLGMGFFNIQVSEVAKICVVIYIASYSVRHLNQVRTNVSGFIRPVVVLTLVGVLLLWEPDLGALVVLAVAVLGILFMAGINLFYLAGVGILAFILIVLLVWIEPYRMARLVAYLDPWADAYGSGYQLTQALIAIGRGSWFGEGLGNSIQKLFYLPEAHTDFVFAVMAEEWGAFGSLLLLALLWFVGWRGMDIGHKAEQSGLLFHGYLAYGLSLLFIMQVFINLGVNTGLLPTKGLALPFISYGGSNLIVNCLTVGMLLRVDYERRQSDANQAVFNELNEYGSVSYE